MGTDWTEEFHCFYSIKFKFCLDKRTGKIKPLVLITSETHHPAENRINSTGYKILFTVLYTFADERETTRPWSPGDWTASSLVPPSVGFHANHPFFTKVKLEKKRRRSHMGGNHPSERHCAEPAVKFYDWRNTTAPKKRSQHLHTPSEPLSFLVHLCSSKYTSQCVVETIGRGWMCWWLFIIHAKRFQGSGGKNILVLTNEFLCTLFCSLLKHQLVHFSSPNSNRTLNKIIHNELFARQICLQSRLQVGLKQTASTNRISPDDWTTFSQTPSCQIKHHPSLWHFLLNDSESGAPTKPCQHLPSVLGCRWAANTMLVHDAAPW